MTWSNKYVGIPQRAHGRARSGVDCWGLVWLVYREELGITLPDYCGYGSLAEHAEIAALIDGAATSAFWDAVSTPAPFDVVLFRRGRWNSHVGILVRPGLMLHVTGDGAKLEHCDRGAWGARLQGYWRPHSTAIEGA